MYHVFLLVPVGQVSLRFIKDLYYFERASVTSLIGGFFLLSCNNHILKQKLIFVFLYITINIPGIYKF